MLEDITAYYTDLVLMQGSPVTQKLEIDNNTSPQTLYQRYAFVRSIVESLAFQEAIHKIITNPVRKWEETTVERNISNVKRLSRRNIHEIITSRDRIPVHSGYELGLPLGLNSVPRTMTVAYKRDTFDNQENRFVKFVLRSFNSFCSELRSKKNANDRLKTEIDKTMDVLNGHLNNFFFKQISMPSQLPPQQQPRRKAQRRQSAQPQQAQHRLRAQTLPQQAPYACQQQHARRRIRGAQRPEWGRRRIKLE